MASRVGIELSPAACRIVELDGAVSWQRRTETSVKSFRVLPASGAQTRAALDALGSRAAAIVVWGAAIDHRQVAVKPGSYEAMHREAMGALHVFGVDTQAAVADVVAVETAAPTADAIVVVTTAAGPAIMSATAPLFEAGVNVRAVMTPAAALMSQARTRRAFAIPGSVEAYVALDESTTCIALMRDAALLWACELPWGYIDANRRYRADLGGLLARELLQSFEAIGSACDVGQVCICSGLPDLRNVMRVERPKPRQASAHAAEVTSSAKQMATDAPQPEPLQPVDAVLEMILYAPDRRLAIIDGRIVGVGDDVRGARVADITSAAVLIRDAQGRLRQLTLGAMSR